MKNLVDWLRNFWVTFNGILVAGDCGLMTLICLSLREFLLVCEFALNGKIEHLAGILTTLKGGNFSPVSLGSETKRREILRFNGSGKSLILLQLFSDFCGKFKAETNPAGTKSTSIFGKRKSLL